MRFTGHWWVRLFGAHAYINIVALISVCAINKIHAISFYYHCHGPAHTFACVKRSFFILSFIFCSLLHSFLCMFFFVCVVAMNKCPFHWIDLSLHNNSKPLHVTRWILWPIIFQRVIRNGIKFIALCCCRLLRFLSRTKMSFKHDFRLFWH